MFKKLWNALKSLKKKEGGFTLIELAVILAVIGILAGVGVMKYVDVTDGAKKTAALARKADLKSSLSMAYAKFGTAMTAAEVKKLIEDAYDDETVTDTSGAFPLSVTFTTIKDLNSPAVPVEYTLTKDSVVIKTPADWN